MKLDTYAKITWCPGCSNFLILKAIKEVLSELSQEGLRMENVVIGTGIGCHGKIHDYINVNSFYGLHGRVVATLVGVKIANPKLTCIAFVGDGDAYSEGLEHIIFAAKRNNDVKVFVHNNGVFALTTGQFTPTTPKGMRTKTTPKGNPEKPINPILIMLSSGATFVARAFAGEYEHMKYIMKEAIRHKGFSFVDILQPCVSFNNTFQFFRERVYKLEESGHDPTDFRKALEKAMEWDYSSKDSRIPIGIFYKKEEKTFEEEFD